MTQEVLDCLRGEIEATDEQCAPRPGDTLSVASRQLPHRGSQGDDSEGAPPVALQALAPEGEADEQCSSLQESTSPPPAAPTLPLAQGRQDAEVTQEQRRQDMRALREHLAALQAQAENIPDFDLQDALRDPAFVRLTAPGVGVPLADAWYALHRREIQQQREENNRRLLSRAVASAARRPREGGDGSAALIAADYRSLSREEQLRVKKRIFEAGARGEKIYP